MLYYSPNIKEILSKIENNIIAKHLLLLEGKSNGITFINCDNSDSGLISFIRVKDAYKAFERNGSKSFYRQILTHYDSDKLLSYYEYYDRIISSSINSMKMGKFVKNSGNFSNIQIEEFVNLFKSTKVSEGITEFEIVEGNKIAEWYSFDKYHGQKWSQLHGSCMARSSTSTFDIYTKNSDVCNMLILKKGDKLIGRALVWKLRKKVGGSQFYMDRIYTTEDYLISNFIDYAIKSKWLYRDSNTVVNFNKNTVNGKLEVVITNSEHKNYPYMDTFKKLDKGRLVNDNKEGGFGIILNRTDGSFGKTCPTKTDKVLRFFNIK